MWSKLKTNTTPPSGLVVGCNFSSVSFSLPFDNPDIKIIARHYRRTTPKVMHLVFAMFCLRFYCSSLSCRAFSSTWLKINIFAFCSAPVPHSNMFNFLPLGNLFQLENTNIKNIFSVPLSCPSFFTNSFYTKNYSQWQEMLFRPTRQFENIFSTLCLLKASIEEWKIIMSHRGAVLSQAIYERVTL